MRKKLGILFFLVTIAGSANLFSMGIGLQGNYNAGEFFAPGIAVTFKLDSTPFYYAVNWRIEEKVQNIGVTADYWVLNKNLVYLANSPLNIFFGIGGFCNLTFNQNDGADAFESSLGLRVPVGVNMYLADGVIEPFVQVAPSFGLRFIPAIEADKVYWPISAGFRIWF